MTTLARQRQDLLEKKLSIPTMGGGYTVVDEWVKAITPEEIENAFYNTVLLDTDCEPMCIVSSIDLDFKESK